MATIKLRGDTINLSLLDRDSLVELKDRLGESLVSIGLQLDKAKADVHVLGEYADPDWYRRATAAKKITGFQIQLVDRELARRRQQAKAARPFGEYFIEAARAVLTDDALESVFGYAKVLMEEAGAETADKEKRL
jgi:hypothetical protein